MVIAKHGGCPWQKLGFFILVPGCLGFSLYNPFSCCASSCALLTEVIALSCRLGDGSNIFMQRCSLPRCPGCRGWWPLHTRISCSSYLQAEPLQACKYIQLFKGWRGNSFISVFFHCSALSRWQLFMIINGKGVPDSAWRFQLLFISSVPCFHIEETVAM